MAKVRFIMASGGKFFKAPITRSHVERIIALSVSSEGRIETVQKGKIFIQRSAYLRDPPPSTFFPTLRSPSDQVREVTPRRNPIKVSNCNHRMGIKGNLSENNMHVLAHILIMAV